MSVYHHADYALLRVQLLENNYQCDQVSDYTEFWRAPHGGELWFDIPSTDTYESVEVVFGYPVTTQELELLQFPL